MRFLEIFTDILRFQRICADFLFFLFFAERTKSYLPLTLLAAKGLLPMV